MAIERPEQRQQSLVCPHIHAYLMHRMNLVHLVMRTRPANARKQGGRQKPPIRQATPQLCDKHPYTLLSGRFFDQPNDGLKVRAKANSLRWRLGAESSQTGQRWPIRQAQSRAARRSLKKSPSRCAHVQPPI
jgi:hypothetical protein